MSALDILEAAAGHMKDRAATYDKPAGERSMGATVAAFKAITGISMTEEQGWLFMGVLKQVRTQQGGWRADNYEDGAAYFALQGEAAERDRGHSGEDGFALETITSSAKISDYDPAQHGARLPYSLGTEAIHAEPSTEDMTDPRNWRAGDWVECVDGLPEEFTSGRLYRLRDTCHEGRARIAADDAGCSNGWSHDRFRFHARPDADGWIEHAGGAMPVKPDVMVDFETARTGAIYCIARNVPWPHVVRYRPHLATKHDKG